MKLITLLSLFPISLILQISDDYLRNISIPYEYETNTSDKCNAGDFHLELKKLDKSEENPTLVVKPNQFAPFVADLKKTRLLYKRMKQAAIDNKIKDSVKAIDGLSMERYEYKFSANSSSHSTHPYPLLYMFQVKEKGGHIFHTVTIITNKLTSTGSKSVANKGGYFVFNSIVEFDEVIEKLDPGTMKRTPKSKRPAPAAGKVTPAAGMVVPLVGKVTQTN